MSYRVLHVVDRLTGGVPVAVSDYIRNSAPQFEHYIASPFVDGAPSPIWSNTRVAHADLGTLLARSARFHMITAKVRPDVIHAHSSFPGALTRLALTKVPIVYSPHGFKFDDPDAPRVSRGIFRAAERLLAIRRTRFATLSAHEARLARALRSNADVHLIPNVASVPPREARPLATTPTVGMVGRIAPQKDPKFFAEIAELARTSSARFRWIGDGDENLRDRLVAAGVEVTGWVARDEMATQLAPLDVYAHVAAYEGFPLSVLDAVASGLPTVVRSIPSLADAQLPTFSSPKEAWDLIESMWMDDDARSRAIHAGDALLRRMNPDAQRRALVDAWTFEAGGSA